jgi:hypothetical protein
MAATLDIPQYNMSLSAGDLVRLSKFSDITWMVGYGWYSANPSVSTCGWYLMRCDKPGTFKSLDLNDLQDIVMVECNHGQQS